MDENPTNDSQVIDESTAQTEVANDPVLEALEAEETTEEAQASAKTEEPVEVKGEVEEQPEEQPKTQPEEDAQTVDPKEQARRAYEQRQAQREAKRRESLEQQQVYLDEAPTAEQLALRQVQVEAYNTRVELNTGKLINGYEKAVNSIDVFQNPTPEIQEVLNDAIDEYQALYVTVDQYGNPTDVRGDIYQFLNKKADTIRRLTQVGARNEKIAGIKSSHTAITPPASSPKEPKKDPIMAILESED